MDPITTFNWIVTSAESGMKLIAFLSVRLKASLPHYSASLRKLKREIESGCCDVNGRIERFATRIVGTGDKVRYTHTEMAHPQMAHAQIKTASPHSQDSHDTQNTGNIQNIQSTPKKTLPKILYEDGDFFILDKPSGITCDEQGVIAWLAPHYPQALLVHRLDRETSGLLILAKREEIVKEFIALFRRGEIRKTYVACVDKRVSSPRGSIENFLVKKTSDSSFRDNL